MEYSIYSKKILALLLKDTFTVGDLYYRVEIIKEYFENVFFVKRKDGVTNILTLRAHAEANKESESTVKALENFEIFLKDMSPEDLYENIAQVKELINFVPVITFYTPIELETDDIKKIAKWFRSNTEEDVVLSLHVDPAFVGGCGFVWKGMYHDYSFKYFMRKRQNELRSFIQGYYEKNSISKDNK